MRRQPDRLHSCRLQDGVERLRIFAVAVMYEMRRGLKRAVEAGDVPRLLRNPFRVRMRRRACDEDSARPDVDEEEDVAGDEAAGCPDMGREEVGRPQVSMGTYEIGS